MRIAAAKTPYAANTTNVINGTPQPGTLLPLNGASLVVRSIPLGTISAGETIKALSEVEVLGQAERAGGLRSNDAAELLE